MKKIITSLLILIINVVTPLSAQEIIPAQKNGKWGYVDLWGATAIPFIFDDAEPFVTVNRAPVKMNGKWGYINKVGENIIPCIYNSVSPYFNNNMAFVKLNGKWGVIDQYGHYKIIPQFTALTTVYSSFSSSYEDLFVGKRNGKFCAYFKLKQILPLDYDSIDIGSDYIIVSKNNKYGMVDTLGKSVFPVEYDKIAAWYSGYYELEKKDEKTFFVHPPQRDRLTYSDYRSFDLYKNGYKVVSLDGCDVYLNPIGENTLGKSFHTARPFSEGVSMVTNFDLSRQCIDTLGNVLFDVPEGVCVGDFQRNGFAVCFNDSTTHLKGLINKKGKIIIKPLYNDIYLAWDYFEAMKDSRNYFYDTSGHLLNYSKIVGPYEGIHLVEYNGKWGVVDSLFNEITPTIYDTICLSYWEPLMACKNGKWGYIDKSGTTVIPFIYDSVKAFDGGVAVVKYKGNYGIIDLQNRCMVGFEYDRIKRDEIEFIHYKLYDLYSEYYPDRVYN